MEETFMSKTTRAREQAEHFLNNEKQFHLGMMPTEQSNPLTRDLDKTFASDAADGVHRLLSVDWNVEIMAQRVLRGPAFQNLVKEGVRAVLGGSRIVFSGCGATGRLSILLESMWRRFFVDLAEGQPAVYAKVRHFEGKVLSIMTGGDHALIRSVENFEDYEQFGRYQVEQAELCASDILVAITEGGETSSVLGTVAEATERGAKAFLLFNNPAELLREHIERSRRGIDNPRVTVLDLYCGAMAVAGSTRMQATTSEQLVAGAALELILGRCLESALGGDEARRIGAVPMDHIAAFGALLNQLQDRRNTSAMAAYIELERELYDKKGLVTYFANDYALDIFTDTTERAPTFNLPPFKKFDDLVSLPSWAFVKCPYFPTKATWEFVLGRAPRCLEWSRADYERMGAPQSMVSAPPSLGRAQIERFHIGNEEDDGRAERTPCLAVKVLLASELPAAARRGFEPAVDRLASKYTKRASLLIGRSDAKADFRIECTPAASLLNLMDHMAVKLVLNVISTGTMVRMGRVTGNWMSWVEVSNKKLRDRSIRLISELCGVSYREACYALHETLEELEEVRASQKEQISPVQYTLTKLRKS